MTTVDTHVAAFAARLRGPAATRRSMIREIDVGLRDAVAAYQDGGLDPGAAAERAVRDFGTVDEIAPQLQEELTARHGRRTALLVALTFPGLVLGWDLLWSNGVRWDDSVPPVVGLLSRAQDGIAVLAAMIAFGLFVATFHRAVPARKVTELAGVVGVVGALTAAGVSVWMNLASSGVPAEPNSVVAFLASGAVLVAVLVMTGRALRLAHATRSPHPADQGTDVAL